MSPWRLLHWTLILIFVGEVAYCAHQVIIVTQPPGTTGPMFGAALDVPHELMVTRRLYAIEGWMTLIGLMLYIGVTEILPRKLAEPTS
jgi:hypothetical protein